MLHVKTVHGGWITVVKAALTMRPQCVTRLQSTNDRHLAMQGSSGVLTWAQSSSVAGGRSAMQGRPE